MNGPRKVLLVVGGITLAFCAGLGVLGYIFGKPYWDFPEAAAALPAEVERARQNGIPFTQAELLGPDKVRPKENAAPAIRALAATLEEPEIKKLRLRYDQAVSEARWADARRLEGSLAPAFREAEIAAARPKVDFARDWEEGPHLSFPELAGVKNGIHLLAARADRRAGAGDPAFSDDLQKADRLARLIGREPILIGVLIEISGRSIVQDRVRRIAARHAQDRAVLDRLAPFGQATPLPDMRRALRGEQFMAVSMMRNLPAFGGELGLFKAEDEPPKFDRSKLLREGLPKDERPRAFLSRLLHTWNEVSPEMGRADQDPRPAMRKLDALGEREGVELRSRPHPLPHVHPGGRRRRSLSRSGEPHPRLPRRA